MIGTRRMSQFAQRLRFDLTDPLAGHGEILSDLLERVVAALANPEAHLENLLFARREGGQHPEGSLCEVAVKNGVLGTEGTCVLDEVAHLAGFLFTNGRFEAHGFLRNLQDHSDLFDRELHLLGELLRHGLSTE